MSRSRELFMQQREMSSLGDDSDIEYFEWLSDKAWQEYLEREREAIEKKYRDAPATLALKWGEFLIKHNLK